MADSETSPATAGGEPNSNPSLPENPPQESNPTDPSPTASSSAPSTSVAINPNPILPPPPILAPPHPPPIQPYGVPQVPAVLPGAPSFRPATPPLPVPSAPQFSPLPVPNLQNPNYPSSGVQNPTVPPPGVVGVPGNSGSVVPMMQQQYAPPGQHLNPGYRPYMTMPNGYPAMQMPQGALPPPGLPRYPYAPMVRPAFPQRPPGAGVIPPLMRAPIPGIRGPIIPPFVRPVSVPTVTPAEKPETTVYVGKMSSTVENDFMLSLLQLCGPIKSWKRPQDPAHGTLKSFGFCEFESAEGVLRALRLLNKLNLDGQELVINVNQATREYLERYVQKKSENTKNSKENGSEGTDKAEENAANADSEPPKLDGEDSKKDESDSGTQEKNDTASFGIVTDEDRKDDRDALEKLIEMLEERLKNNPLPPPPPPPRTPADGFGNLNSEHPARSRDGEPDVDIMKHDGLEGKNEDEITSDNKPTGEHDRPETSSPDRNARHDRRGKEKDRDQKREKERELERYEREREQERARRERERDYKVKDDERRYKARMKEWETREREKEYLRKQEKEKEKERINKRKREVLDQEYDDDDVDSKRRKHRNSGSEDRRRRLREKEEDLEDKLKEEEEVAEAKRKAEEEIRQKKEQEKDLPEILPDNSNYKTVSPHETDMEVNVTVEETSDGEFGHRNHIGEGMLQNGNGDDSNTEQVAASDTRQHSNVQSKKLGFGLVGSGKRTTVPSVFSEDEDENAQKEKKMRPLVPIDYSTEEVQAVQSTVSTPPSSNLAAAAEFAKRISSGTPKEDRPDVEKERSRRPHDRYNQRDRDRNDDDSNRTRDSSRKASERDRDRDRDREHGMDKVKTPDNRKLMDAKQLIDMIPKTKDELFSYEINWVVYDKNELHDRLRPWISKKITEFLGEEETTLVDYIVSSMREHVKASEMLERLQSILDDESEMFVLKMWRMLIFEIKKIETGLALRAKS